jgi:hypothetical protein
MDQTPFRVLSNAEFRALPLSDKIRYINRAIEAHRILSAQIAEATQPAETESHAVH